MCKTLFNLDKKFSFDYLKILLCSLCLENNSPPTYVNDKMFN